MVVIYDAGFGVKRRETLDRWTAWAARVAVAQGPLLPPRRVFKPKVDLPVLVDYSAVPEAGFWETFPVNKAPGKSMISAARLRGLALAVGCSDERRLAMVCEDLERGALIGCVGRFRGASRSRNAPSALEYPREVTDAVASWVKAGFAVGPFLEEEVPAGVKVNGIMTRPKPNGAVRIILNLSSPKGAAVNEGIDVAMFPATMSSTAKWLAVLGRAGRQGVMIKMDWADAYKHVHVRPEDVPLQWFSWLGRFFAEVCLVFGAVSSPGIYDRAAKVVLDLVLRMSGFPAELVCQHLDDVCAAAGEAAADKLAAFEQCYRRVAADVGVKLAPADDSDKGFTVSTRGVVLGVEYDTVAWTWAIPPEKVARLVVQIQEALAADSLRQDEVWSLVGRIVHYCPLVPCGRFNLDYLLRANAAGDDRAAQVELCGGFKRQLQFWLLIIRVSSGWARIPDLGPLPAWTVEAFTDAAGGSLEGFRGSGGVVGDWWYFLPWSAAINAGDRASDGKRLSKKLSALELIGPLAVVAAAPDICRGQPVRVWVDNAGSVKIWEKGYSSSCGLCTTIVKAAASVAAALDCRLEVHKVRRCSSPGAVMADALSKGDFRRFRAAAAEAGGCPAVEPAAVPRALRRWLVRPKPDDELGQRILLEMAQGTPLLGYNRM
jgi:hypothetical protein